MSSVDEVRRRQVLKLLGASMALGGLSGCDDPATASERLVPAVIAPPGMVPGRPDFYSTATLSGGYALGVLVEHVSGRPIKVEGNAAHPTSRGGTDALAQAAILDFYDPDRSIGLLQANAPSSRPALLAALAAQRARLDAAHGAGLRIVSGPVVSPSLAGAIRAVLARWPEARWHLHDPAGRGAAREAARLAYGRDLDVVPDVAQADVVLALQSDLVDGAPGHVRHARAFAGPRNPVRGAMSRVYAAEYSPTLTGVAGDHRFVVDAAEMAGVVAGLAAGIGGGAAEGPPWLAAVVADLLAHRGRALIHAGPELPASVQAQVHGLNERLGAVGRTVRLIAPVAAVPDAGMAALLADMQAGLVGAVVVIDCNPVLTAPGFGKALSRVGFSLGTAPLLEETGRACGWFVPQAHGFETWGDARADDGTATIMQPQAVPLWGGMSPLALLPLLATGEAVSPLAAVRETWRAALPTDGAWRDALASGVVPGSEAAPVTATVRTMVPLARGGAELSLVVRQDAYLGDGRGANNAWLQELPRPLTKVVWDNPLLIGPGLAGRMGLVDGDEVEVSAGTARVRLPVLAVPGQADDCVVATLGYGRRVGGVASGVGVDVAPLLAGGVPALRKTGVRHRIASTGHHHALSVPADRVDEVVRQGTLAAFTQRAGFLQDAPAPPSLYAVHPPGAVAWGMSIDLGACIGCNACVVACTAENNVPVVGREAVLQAREMHWLRIDRYYKDAEPVFQPVLCMHCEQAPCEVVCPVGATQHDEEGLNVMTYNRCVGTRFCSNNCPYKVRRFNFAAYAAEEMRPPIARNPDVSVRARGVMEKCTFCVQRIAQARIVHDRDGAPEQAVTACQAACPTQAFTFGDLNDPASAVRARKASPLDYALLPEQNTRPRVTYEARIRNPNPAIG